MTLTCDVTQGLTVLCVWLCSLAPLLTCLGRLMGLREGKRHLEQPTPVGPTLCDPMDCSPPGSSIHGTSQARILEGVSVSFSRGSSQHRNCTHISCLAGSFFTTKPSGKPKGFCQCRRHRRLKFNPWVRKIPKGGNGNPLQYSCLENPMDRKVWRAIVFGVAKSHT